MGQWEDSKLMVDGRQPDANLSDGVRDFACPSVSSLSWRIGAGSAGWPDARTDRVCFRPALPPPGLGLGLTTYEGDGDPLPPFRGDPLWLPLAGDAKGVLEAYWSALDSGNQVSLAVKQISAAGGPGEIRVRNRTA